MAQRGVAVCEVVEVVVEARLAGDLRAGRQDRTIGVEDELSEPASGVDQPDDRLIGVGRVTRARASTAFHAVPWRLQMRRSAVRSCPLCLRSLGLCLPVLAHSWHNGGLVIRRQPHPVDVFPESRK